MEPYFNNVANSSLNYMFNNQSQQQTFQLTHGHTRKMQYLKQNKTKERKRGKWRLMDYLVVIHYISKIGKLLKEPLLKMKIIFYLYPRIWFYYLHLYFFKNSHSSLFQRNFIFHFILFLKFYLSNPQLWGVHSFILHPNIYYIQFHMWKYSSFTNFFTNFLNFIDKI